MRRNATFAGFGAIALWGALAVLTVAAGAIPPFQLTAMTFAIGGVAGLAVIAARGQGFSALRQPPIVWLHGVAGLFGYHALYFAALALAPAAEANLINYLWPLLIVLFAAFLPGERLLFRHVAGAIVGFAGAFLLIAGGGGLSGAMAAAPGYAAALGCALVWSIYSVTVRLLPPAPTEAVAGFCLVTAALAGIAHGLFEATVWALSAGQIAAVVGLGLGPVGLAFYLWDIGTKRGDILLLGAASYGAPALSTLLLIAVGVAAPSISILAAILLVAAGGAIAAGAPSKRR